MQVYIYTNNDKHQSINVTKQSPELPEYLSYFLRTDKTSQGQLVPDEKKGHSVSEGA